MGPYFDKAHGHICAVIVILFIYLFILLLFKASPKLENWFLSYVSFYPNDMLGTQKKKFKLNIYLFIYYYYYYFKI